ncbi:MAG: DUF262 domain-containing protein [Xenococcaceae cyanobacterium MO_207.B15]|nr:DUF262 domain-containing protein [Xenococcaceae cyanobacterium MO_207.B15]
MKATETNLLDFLREPKQFVIPIYQRNYSWTTKQCQQLWDDLMRIAKNPRTSGHFLGSVVYIEHGLYHITSLPKLLVIDGQQRLTTISILLKALGKAIQISNIKHKITTQKINNYFLFNQEEDEQDKYKLLLNKNDRDIFTKLINDYETIDSESHPIINNFKYFDYQIRKNNIDLDLLYFGLSKLLIVDISLDRDRDNPQLIFESLNSTGLDLSQADLIRNYILMDLEPKKQNEVYDKYWYPMEQCFGRTGYVEHFDKFMRCYLTVKSKSGSIPKINDVYNSFKNYVQKQTDLSIENHVKDIYRYSDYYIKLAFDQEINLDIKKCIANINQLKVDVAYPFLMEVYDDFTQKMINNDDFLEILKIIESYVFRRSICGIPTNSMNKTFASLSRGIDKNNYLKSLKQIFSEMKSSKRFPDNEEFKREFIVKDIYNFRNCNYLLYKLENYDRTKELVAVDEYSIEHIMPQNNNLSQEWKDVLGENWKEIHSKYLQTIGNLTLTGYNSKYSDRYFQEKKYMKDGFADSPLRLNKTLAKVELWNEQSINNRATLLAEKAIKIWKIVP